MPRPQEIVILSDKIYPSSIGTKKGIHLFKEQVLKYDYIIEDIFDKNYCHFCLQDTCDVVSLHKKDFKYVE